MRTASTSVLYELIKKDPRVIAVTADSRNDILTKIRDEYPQQFIDYGIAESNMVASAAGLASCGRIPFVFGVTNFIAMRAYEFIRNDVAIAGKNVKFIGIFSGLVRGKWGATHQGTEDVGLLRCLPNILTITPATPREAGEVTKYAYTHTGPVYIRLEASNEPELYDSSYVFKAGTGHILHDGNDATIITMGSIVNEALRAAEYLSTMGIGLKVISMSTLNPIDQELIVKTARETQMLLTLEEHSIYGGLGSAVSEILAESGISIPFSRMGLHGCVTGCGNQAELREICGIGMQDIIRRIMMSQS